MALVLVTGARTILADALGGIIDTGTAQTGGKLVIETSADAEISLHRFDNPFDSGAVAGVITMSSAPKDDTSAQAGTAAQFSIFDRDDAKVLEGVVQVTGADLDLSSLAVGLGDTVSLTAFSLTVP